MIVIGKTRRRYFFLSMYLFIGLTSLFSVGFFCVLWQRFLQRRNLTRPTPRSHLKRAHLSFIYFNRIPTYFFISPSPRRTSVARIARFVQPPNPYDKRKKVRVFKFVPIHPTLLFLLYIENYIIVFRANATFFPVNNRLIEIYAFFST